MEWKITHLFPCIFCNKNSGFIQNNKYVNPIDFKFKIDKRSQKEFLMIKWENMKFSFFYCIN